ncbi:MAG: prolipoprotein diacylglyceryl transferase [Bacteroidales bacterium]|nr:prolipoprotein diacylglyceryl transferase [Candidatus Colimorpha merdihippi]
MLLNFVHWNVDPVMFHLGSFGLRYYSLGFLFAFLLGYLVLNKMFAREKVEIKYLDTLVVWVFLAVLIGARLGHCFFYEPDYFCTADHWPEIILPFNLQTGQFTGYQGLASHGAAIAIILTIWLYYRKFKINAWWLFDRLVIVVALGGFFIRLGNLFNSEIYGVQTSLPWGFIYERNGEVVPKHPTQLYESFSYLIIFLVCLWTYRKKEGKLHNGRLFGYWLVALFGVRFLIEFVKEEQVAFEQGMTLDMGQWLSIPFVIGGIVLVVLSHKGVLREGTFIEKNMK